MRCFSVRPDQNDATAQPMSHGIQTIANNWMGQVERCQTRLKSVWIFLGRGWLVQIFAGFAGRAVSIQA